MTNQVSTTTSRTLFVAVYCTGGTQNFEWHRAIPNDRDTVKLQVAELERQGRKAFCVEYEQSMAIGLPEGY